MNNKDLLCSSCMHEEVCPVKNTYASFQEAINNVTNADGYALFNERWIDRPRLSCRFWCRRSSIKRDDSNI